MLAERAPHLALDGAVLKPALAGQPVGRRCDRVLLRWNVEALDDEKPIACEEAFDLRDSSGACIVVEYPGEGIVRRDDEVVLTFLGQAVEACADVEDAPGVQPLDERLPLGGVAA